MPQLGVLCFYLCHKKLWQTHRLINWAGEWDSFENYDSAIKTSGARLCFTDAERYYNIVIKLLALFYDN